MGSVCCHHFHSQKKKLSLAQTLDTNIIGQKLQQSFIDLPYRHYVSKNYYVPSALPHSLNFYKSKQKIQISQSIKESSILSRRFHKEILKSTKYGTAMITEEN